MTLQADSLSLAYEKITIVEQLALTITTGQITTLVGPNGCGKSTLLRGLARLLKPKAGQVVLNGRAISQMPTKTLAKQLGILPQSPAAPEGLTVYELVAQGRYPHQGFFQQWSNEDERIAQEALAITHMIDFANRPLDTLSGGQRQRAWIAMALAQDTPILLLDEPTTYLDIGHQIEVMELVQTLNRERRMTILLVLHDLNQAARYSDRMVVMQDGAIVADGSPQEMMTPQMLADVFQVRVTVVDDPVSSKPVCLPYGIVRGADLEVVKTAVPSVNGNGLKQNVPDAKSLA